MHSSRMLTAACIPQYPSLGGGLGFPGGSAPGGGAKKEMCLNFGEGLKILPCPNFVWGGGSVLGLSWFIGVVLAS